MITYVESCPLCGGDINDREALLYGVCSKCKHNGKTPFEYEKKKTEEFIEFFKSITGNSPWGIQISWIKNFVLGESFPIMAPPGIGKTTFGMVAAYYSAKLLRKKAYIVLPTRILVKELTGKLNEVAKDIRVISYNGRRKEKEEIADGKFDILITTGRFLSKNVELLKDKKIEFFFIDDVDYMIRSPKSLTYLKEIAIPSSLFIFSSATLRPKGKSFSIFVEEFGFLPGGAPVPIRNVIDIVGEKSIETLEEIIKNLSTGGLLLFPKGKKEEMEEVTAILREKGYNLSIFESEDDLERFKKGELSLLCHTISPYGKLIRGLDLPEIIKYVIFYGVPVFEFSFDNLSSLVLFLRIVEKVVEDEELSSFIDKIYRKKEEEYLSFRDQIERFVKKYANYSIYEKLSKRFNIVVRDGTILFPDVTSYIQASGRTSRLYRGTLTKGASFILENDRSLIDALNKGLYLRFGDAFEFLDLKKVDLRRLWEELLQSRKRGNKIRELKKVLLIVESPTKARTISHFFGKPTIKMRNNTTFYEVFTGEEILSITASKGHLYELTTDPQKVKIKDEWIYGVRKENGYNGYFECIRKCMNCGAQYAHSLEKCPICGNQLSSQRQTISSLRKESFLFDEIWLAQDPDREGEKISYDLQATLKGIVKTLKRIELHEITKNEFIKAKRAPREVFLPLINGYLFRRYEDRWIGFSLSKILMKVFRKSNLSAGRVQSPVLGWVIERWKDSKKKKRILTFSVYGQRVTIDEANFTLPKDAEEIKINLDIKEDKKSLSPSPPFDTSSLLSYSNRVLKISSNITMKIAQDLFSNGFITYHRTDTRYISEVGRNIARLYLDMKGLSDAYSPRSWGTPGTHEGIRPTRPIDTQELIKWLKRNSVKVSFTKLHFRLYEAIFKRFIASQMKDETLIFQRIAVSGPWREPIEIERPVNIEKKGFGKIIPIKVYDEVRDTVLYVKPEVKTVSVAFPYTQAELIDAMKEKKIGRPSTYAHIIKTLLDRRFVIQRGKNGYLIPTSLGIKVYSFMKEKYPEIIDEDRTRQMEEEIDLIIENKIELNKALDDLLKELAVILEEVRLQNSEEPYEDSLENLTNLDKLMKTCYNGT